MSHAAAKERILSLVEALVPTTRAAERFVRRHKGSGRSGARVHARRTGTRIRQNVEYIVIGRERSEWANTTPFLYREEGVLEVPYYVGGDAVDLDALDNLIWEDAAAIRLALQQGYTNAPKAMEHLEWGGRSETRDERDDNEAITRRVLVLSLINEHYA